MLRQFGYALLGIIALDALWLGLLMSAFYRQQLAHLARIVDGRLAPIWPVAALVYPAIAAGIAIFVVSRARSPLEAVALGALFGLVTYSVYDLTNHATLRDWPAVLTVVDITWGTVMCATVSGVVSYLTRPA